MKWIKSKTLMLLLLIASLCLSVAGSAFAFNDVGNDPEKASIERLEKLGILKGDGKGNFAPNKTMNAATAVSLLVKGMELNIDNMRFIKAPEASDHYTKVPNTAWYAQAFVIAHFNRLDLPQDIDPAANATREQFTHWLYKAILKKGDYAWIGMYMELKDEKSVNPAYMEAVQRLVMSKIATLDADQNFRPKQAITRSEAAGMFERALQFVSNTPPIEPIQSVFTDVKLTTDKISDEVKRVTITAQAPNPGYGIEVSSVLYGSDGKAVINYRQIPPDPDQLYTQVITEVKAIAYVSSNYESVLGSDEWGSGSVSSRPHPIRNPDGTSGSTGDATGLPTGK